jgi:superfamily I DNA/RNA helicase
MRADPWLLFLSRSSEEALNAFEELLRDPSREAVLSESATRRIVATVHSCKGSEHHKVAVPASFLHLAQSQNAEERNIAFVALSRHRSVLVLVESDAAASFAFDASVASDLSDQANQPYRSSRRPRKRRAL